MGQPGSFYLAMGKLETAVFDEEATAIKANIMHLGYNEKKATIYADIKDPFSMLPLPLHNLLTT